MTSAEARSLIAAVRSLADGHDPLYDQHVADLANALDRFIRSDRVASELSEIWHAIATVVRCQSTHRARLRAMETAFQVQSERITKIEALIYALIDEQARHGESGSG